MLSRDRLLELLNYDAETGNFSWRVARGSVTKGSLVGTSHSCGYARVRIDGELYYCHRLVFLIEDGVMPEFEVDHIDGNTSNNKRTNLRKSTHKENLTSTKLRKDNTSGHKGVYYKKDLGKFVVQAKVNGKQTYFGIYLTLEEAAEKARQVREEYFKEFARHE